MPRRAWSNHAKASAQAGRRAAVAGFDCWRQSREVRQLVSYLPGELRLFGPMRALEVLRYLSDLRGGEALDRAVAIAERIMMLDLRRRRNQAEGMEKYRQQADFGKIDFTARDRQTLS